MKKEIKELEALGAKVKQVNGGLRLIGDWSSMYDDYHELFVEITGTLYTNSTVQDKDFLRGVKSILCLNTSNTVQHKDFLRRVESIGRLDTRNVVQDKDFLRGVKSIGSLYTNDVVQHEDFFREAKSIGGLVTSNAVQHKDFLRGIKSIMYLNTSHAVQHKNFLRGVESIGGLNTWNAVQHKDSLQGVKSIGRLYTRGAVQDKDFLRGVKSIGSLDTWFLIQHEDFLKNSTDTFELPMIYVDGILSEVHSTKFVDGVTIHSTTRVGYTYTEYIATDGRRSAHASSIAIALSDLRFKKEGIDTSWLEGKRLSDTLSFEDAVIAYRAVTGACSGGVDGFLRGRKQKKQYLISEIIEETKGHYGNEVFEKFFV